MTKISKVITTFVFLKLKMHQNSFSAPFPSPFDAEGRLELGASVLRAPQHKILATPVV